MSEWRIILKFLRNMTGIIKPITKSPSIVFQHFYIAPNCRKLTYSSKMIKHWNSDLMLRPPSGTLGLLKDSFKTIKGNKNLLLPVLVSVFLIEPVVEDILFRLVERSRLLLNLGSGMHRIGYSDPIIRIGGEVLLVNIFILNFCSITSLLFFNSTKASSSTSKLIDLKEMILKIGESRNKVTLTCFHMYLVIMGPIFVWFCSMGITSVLAKGSWTFVIYGVLVLSVIVYEFYVSALGMMSLVVSVLEGVGGLNAIVRARELMTGKNVQACLIMVMFVIAHVLVYSITSGVTSRDVETWSRLAILIRLSKGLLSLLKLFVFVVFIVFYLERKERCGEKEYIEKP